MNECVIRVKSQHHLDVIIDRVRSLGGKYEHHKYVSVPSDTMYTIYRAWVDSGLPVYMWLHNWGSLVAEIHNHDCSCEVQMSVQDAIEYLGLNEV